jgi:hypothetical protein
VVDSGFAGCSVVITAPSSECVQDLASPHPSLRNNTLSPDASARPLRPKSDRSLIIMQSVAMCHNRTHAPQQPASYSITSSAIASTPGGIVRSSALAVLRLIANSNLVGCRTGRSAGLSLLRMRPT